MASANKAPVVKKAATVKKPKTHPPYADMIKEAIVSLKERTGSSQYAIAKHIEDKQKDLPPNFKKQLLVQLKKLVAAGKLTKIKNSFKLCSAEKPKAPVTVKKAPEAKKVPAKKAPAAKKAAAPKAKAGTQVKAKKVVAKAKAPLQAKKVVKKAIPVKAAAKKPKSIKSPAKKVAAKKAKK